MLRRVTRLLGGFVIYPSVVPDWRQFFSRDDLHVAAKEQLKALAEAPQDGDPQLADQLVTAFMRSHNAEALTRLIRLMREDMKMELLPYHYHALLRVFNFDRDKQNMESVLGIMFQRKLVSQETFALIIDGLHTLGSLDVLERIVQVIQTVHDECGGFLFHDADTHVGRRSSAPVLSSLLHHLAHDPRYPPFMAVMVIAWMEAIGAVLSDWDYVNVTSALLSKSSQFPAARLVYGFVDDCAPGSFSLGALVERALKFGEKREGGGSEEGGYVAVLKLMKRLYGGQSESWCKVVNHSCLINLRITSLKTQVARLMRHCVLCDRGLGPQQRNPLPVLHTMALLHSTLRNEMDAVGVLPVALQLFKTWQRKYPEEAIQSTDDANAETPVFHPHLLMDLGMLFERCSEASLAEIAPSYSEVADMVSSTATDAQVAACGAYALTLMTTDAEASASWQHIIASVDATATRVPHTVRSLVKSFVSFCARHPRGNHKMTPKGLAEREKWARYIESRDCALVMFGTAPQARDAMRHLFYNNGQPQALRNSDMIEKDISDVCTKLFPHCSPDGAWRRERLSKPLLPFTRDAVPPHLWDPEVENPYPRCVLRRSPMDAEGIQTDYFPMVWTALMSSSEAGIGAGRWYYRDPEMFLGLLRCLVYRLDWEAAVQLTIRSVQHFEFTSLMDQELQAMFTDIGDPFGALLFKTATKLYDARIVADSASKREHFHAKMGNTGAQEKVLREERTRERDAAL